MVFKKGQSGNAKGSAPGVKRSKRGSGTWRKSILWAYEHMADESGKEGRPPSGSAKAMLEEARKNPSKFLDRVERVLKVGESNGAESKESVPAQDVHYGEVIDLLLKEFENGAMGGGGPAGPAREPEVQEACQGQGREG